MPPVDEKNLMEDLDFKCARCSAECAKVNAIEPELGYVSNAPNHVGEFIGPLCTNCYNEIPEKDRAVRKIPDTAFIVVLKGDGEGTYITTENIEMLYRRNPTVNDVTAACNQVIRDVNDSMFAQKLTMQLARMMSAKQKSPKVFVP